jgi:mediator of RNA polymerase II transcription subunit 13, fungi type
VSLKESYCLSRRTINSKSQQELSLENVFEKIWHLTVEITKQVKINWKVIIVRIGGMSKNEIGIWNVLKENHSSELLVQVRLLLASIDLNPPLSISLLNTGPVAASPVATISTPFPSAAAFSQSSPAAMGNAYGTPVATPLAQTNESPDPSGAIMSTPGGTANTENATEFDPEARWVDATDEIWGIMLNHRVPACQNTDPEKEVRFSLASGFLWPTKSTLPHNLIQVSIYSMQIS